MIRNIFIPERIGSYYILSKRIVGIDVGRSEIHATITQVKGHTRTIEQFIHERIENDTNMPHEDRIIKSLKIVLSKLGAYDAIYAAFPSSSVIFKELILPFTGISKIKQVVPFEVESLLPFTLDQAVIDSIVTKEDNAHKSSDILVAAVKKEALAEYTHVLHAAGITPDKITVDMFELYGLYKTIPSYQALRGTVALIDIGLYVTRLALIVDGQLKYIRSIAKGIVTVAKKLSNTNGSDTHESLRQLLRFGTEESESMQKSLPVKQLISELLQEINFTITTITGKLKAQDQLHHCVITGTGAEIPGINDLVSTVMGVKSEILQGNKIIYNGTIHSKVKTIPSGFLISLATSLALPITQEFDLQQKQAKEQQEHIISKQLITFAVLALVLISSFALYSFFAIRNLRVTRNQAAQETIEDLQKAFKLKSLQQTGSITEQLADALKRASRTLEQQESTWRKLLTQNRYFLLNYLTQLSKCINIKEPRLTIQQLVIKSDTIELWGEVPSHDYLIKLQNQLNKCPLFKSVPRLQEYDFTKKPIVLTINKD